MVGLSQLMCGLPLGYTVHTSAFACGTSIAATLANINRLANNKRIFVPPGHHPNSSRPVCNGQVNRMGSARADGRPGAANNTGLDEGPHSLALTPSAIA